MYMNVQARVYIINAYLLLAICRYILLVSNLNDIATRYINYASALEIMSKLHIRVALNGTIRTRLFRLSPM